MNPAAGRLDGPPTPSSRRMPWPQQRGVGDPLQADLVEGQHVRERGQRQRDRQVVPEPGTQDPLARRRVTPASSSAAAAAPRIVRGWTSPEIVIASLPARFARRHAAATSVGVPIPRRRRRRCPGARARRRRRSRPARRAGRRGRTPRRGRGLPWPRCRRSRRGTRATAGSALPRRSPSGLAGRPDRGPDLVHRAPPIRCQSSMGCWNAAGRRTPRSGDWISSTR